jgi:signal transduction histidine kinase
VQSSQDQDSVLLSVKDNGIGIDLSKNGSKMFGLYKRFNIDVPGKGIGLHLVKAQVEALGGRVEVESVVNAGSEFKVFLPRKNEVPA